MNVITGWFFRPVPLGRIAALRTLAYLFIPVDLLLSAHWVLQHKDVPGELYQPLFIGRLLSLPTPTHTLVVTIFSALLLTSLIASFNKAPRLLGIAIFFLYFEWMIIAMSYGKVDHDRFAYLVLLAVLPTIGKASWGDKVTLSERAGWAVNLTQIAVICTYFFAAWAKIRFGGIEWLNGATLTQAVIRRGSLLSGWTVHVPHLLQIVQWGIVAFEILSPIVLFISNQRVRIYIIGFFYIFHLVTFSAIGIIFLPHLIAMTSFLPLEEIRPIVWVREKLNKRNRRIIINKKPTSLESSDQVRQFDLQKER